MASSNHIKNVAIIGAGGNSGSHMVKSLLETGKHTVTALTRPDSTSKLPDGVNVKHIDYDNHSSIVEALRGQDALVITLSVFAPPDQQEKLFRAAADANVPWVLPNEWGPDTTFDGLTNDVSFFAKLRDTNKRIEELGKFSYIAVTCGFWYEWSLAIPSAYGIDLQKKEATLIDEGEAKMNTSTWPQVGRAVAAILSLPIKPEGGDTERCLEKFRNQHVNISSFKVNQKDMLESAMRVTGTSLSDWRITKEPAQERFRKAEKALKAGDRSAFSAFLYTRVFYADDSGDYEKRKGLQNELLGLPKEDLDEATRVALKRSENPHI